MPTNPATTPFASDLSMSVAFTIVGHALHRLFQSLRLDAVPPLRPERPAAPRHLARPLAQLRRRPAARDLARDPPPRLRSRRHPLRPGEQLRPAVRLGRGDVRADLRRRLPPLPRRADHLDEGRLRHVARPLRRVGLAQVRARLARPVARAHGARVRRHLLLAPLRPGDAARRDDGRARSRGALGQGALRRASRRTRRRRRARRTSCCAPWARRS